MVAEAEAEEVVAAEAEAEAEEVVAAVYSMAVPVVSGVWAASVTSAAHPRSHRC
jgi:hypothetical protein